MYDLLPQRDTHSPTSEETEDEKLHPPQKRILVSTVTLLGLTSTTLVSVLLLLLLFTLRGSPQCLLQDHGCNVSRPYGRENTSRTNLDHEYDHMWSIFEGPPAFGLMSKDNPDTAGMISMCVLERWAECTYGC